MKRLFIMIVLTFAFSATGQAGSKNLDLETWFELENRNQIQNLHLHMVSINEKDLGG